jgi:hypothetical protein
VMLDAFGCFVVTHFSLMMLVLNKMRRPHPDSIYTKYLEGLREQGGLNV